VQNDLDDVRLAHVADSEQQTELIVSLADDRVLAKQQRLGSLLGPTEPCLRRRESTSAHGKDPRNHVFDVGGLISARGKTHGNHVFDVGGRCPSMGRTQGTMS